MTDLIPATLMLCVEDRLAEAIGRRLVAHCLPATQLGIVVRRQGGQGYLSSTAQAWNRAARSIPVLMLTDLDRTPCVSSILEKWFGKTSFERCFCFRVAVRECESWVLADRDRCADFLAVSKVLIDSTPDVLVDPKQTLINLARKSRSRVIREGLCPGPATYAIIGPRYNDLMCEFVNRSWSIEDAAKLSPSLAGTLKAIRVRAIVWSQSGA